MKLFNKQKTLPFRRALRKRATDEERRLWNALRSKKLNGFRFTRQYGIGNYIVDFYCASAHLAIELDGGGHADPETALQDEARTQFLASKGIRVLRFWNPQVRHELEGVLNSILVALTHHPADNE